MIPWRRYWVPRDGRVLLGADGFLVDPDTDWGRKHSLETHPVNFAVDQRCIVLLGEPGSGKSTTFDAQRREVEPWLTETGRRVFWLDLHEVGSDDQLARRLFDAPGFKSWKEGDGELFLFLDSFDECRLQINTLHYAVIAELKASPIARLRLRIACRVADWPPAFEQGLRELWGKDAVDVFELAPLRRIDVALAAETAGVDPEKFLRSVAEARATPLAIKPLTLEFLLASFKRHGTLPDRQWVLFQNGCRRLCLESKGREELRVRPVLDADQRLALAERIAAYIVYCNFAAISTAASPGEILEEDLPIQSLVGGTEATEGVAFVITKAAVDDALNTGLFSSRGEHRLGWAHQTYAEYLAARYVVERNFSLPQIMSLLVHPDDPEGKLVPQLHETAVWLAGMRSDVLDAILTRDPEVVLRSDLTNATDNVRAAAVSALLEACIAGKWVDRDWGLKRAYAKLRHPALAEQLRRYVLDPSNDVVVRRVAIHIAEECKERGLLQDLTSLALDDQVQLDIRVRASYAIIDMGDEDFTRQLRPLIDTPLDVDPNAELKGCGLIAVWPKHLTTGELLQALSPPPTNLLGAYRSFLGRDPFQHMPPQDLSLALQWAGEWIGQRCVPFEMENLYYCLMDRSSHHLELSDVFRDVGRLALARLGHWEPVFSKDSLKRLQNETDRRHLILVAMVAAADPDDNIDTVIRSGLLCIEDALWLLAQYSARAETERRKWAHLLLAAVDYEDIPAVNAVWSAMETDGLLAEVLAPRFAPIVLGSEEEARARHRHQVLVENPARWAAEPPLLQPTPSERVNSLLRRFESGDISVWWGINRELTLEPRSTNFDDRAEFEADLTRRPGWRDADEETRSRLIAAADRYVRTWVPEPEKWIAVDEGNGITIHKADWAGFRAFWLLQTEAPERLAAIPPNVWVQWAPVLVGFRTLSPSEADIPHQLMAARAYQHAPGPVLRTLLNLVDAEQTRESPAVDRILWRVERCWNDDLSDALLAKVSDGETSPSVLDQVLEALLRRSVEPAVRLALSLVPRHPLADETERARAAVAGGLLLKHQTSLGWPSVWGAMQEDDAYADAVLGRFVWRERWEGASFTAALSEDDLASLYVWLSCRYSPADDPMIDGVVEYRAAVGQWRDGLLTELRLRGTREACQSFARITVELPDQTWLTWTLLEAKALTRQRTWIPPKVEDIRALARSTERRFVQSAEQLQDVVIESLRRFEDKLQRAEPPAAIDLWDEVAKGAFKPRDEERLSDRLKRHLDDDLRDRGIVFNREVQNRRGEETDIHVTALPVAGEGEELDPITLNIEVKGCWNRELKTAMETQLVRRYLADAHTSHGLYVVGWYTCEKWDTNDPRRKRAPKYGIVEAQERFDQQAAELSKGGTHVRAVVLDTSLRF